MTSNRFSRQAHTQNEIHMQDEISSQLYLQHIKLRLKIQYSAGEFEHLKQILLTVVKFKSFLPGSGRQQTETRKKSKSAIET